MSENLKQRVALSPERRALLELLLKEKRGNPSSRQRITRVESTDTYPLSFEQERLWFLHLFDPNTLIHNLSRITTLEGPLDVKALQKSFDEVVRRHEILRTTLTLADGRPVQIVQPARSGMLPFIDLMEVPIEEREARAEELAETLARTPFEMTKGPLLRAALLRMSDEKHQLILTIHHVITDWWSFGVFHRELLTLYQAFSSGATSPLAELSINYGDYARWQRERLQGPELEKLLSYWKQQLSDCPQLLNLPTDHPRPLKQTFHGKRFHFEFPKELFRSLEDFSRTQDVTAFTAALAVFQVLLHRYTSEAQILVATPSANRDKLETEGLIGFFLNTLVLRGDLSGDPTFSELLARARQTVMGAFAHQDLPFQKLVQELNTDRNLSVMPLVQVCFVFLSIESPNLEAAIPQLNGRDVPSLSLQLTNVEIIASEFDLTLSLENRADSIYGFFEYNTELFDQTTISRMVGHLRVLMEAAVANPDQRISQLPLLTAEERDRLLMDSAGSTTAASIPFQHIHRAFEFQAETNRDAIAVIFNEEPVTYGELNKRANKLARYLTQLGVGPGVRVAILLERSVEMMVGLLGILKAGAAYVPLDPDYPDDRLCFMLNDCNAPVLLTDSRLSRSLPGCFARVVYLDAGNEVISQQSTENLDLELSRDDLVYVIYTSGSTGQPKGVMVPHGGVVNYIAWMQERHRLTAADRFLCKTSLNFDASILEFFWPLTVGASVMIARHEGQRDAAYLAGSIVRHGVTAAFFVPSMLAVFVEEPRLAQASSLRKVICGGESLSAEVVQQFYRRLPHAELHHSYGPTETSVAVAEFFCPRNSEQQVMPLGRPLGDNQLYVLDWQMEPVPVGVTGELYIGGTGLARGYHGRPGLTAEKFIPNPFGVEAGARLYRTGDLARYRADGLLEFRGRTDSQIKLRGMRVELGEIEAVVREHAGVEECVVMLRGEGIEAELVAYIVSVDETGPGADELRAYLASRLPRHMVPAAFVTLKRLPLMVNGKLDRHALPAPSDGALIKTTAAFVAPATELERTIAGIWNEVLGREEIGTQDNFFDLGGHSLWLLQVHLKLRQAIGREIPLVELFQYPTVSKLAAHLQAGSEGESLNSSEERGERRKQQSAQQRHRRQAVVHETTVT